MSITTARAEPVQVDRQVSSVGALIDRGMTRDEVRAQLDGGRWRRYGRAVVQHNGRPTPAQWNCIALVNAGPRSVLTSFTALQVVGLADWRRDSRHVLVPVGANVRTVPGLPVTIHRTTDWRGLATAPGRPDVHAADHAAVRAAASTTRERIGCALLAATVQQGLVRPAALRDLVVATPNLRHRPTLLRAIDDIAMGAHALSEIDFAVLCRRAGLVEPDRQAVRVEPSGRRRYLDVEWRRADGQHVVAEVDAALHLAPTRWWDDQVRQNEVSIRGAIVLRFPSVVVREGDPLVIDQLRRAGVPTRPR